MWTRPYSRRHFVQARQFADRLYETATNYGARKYVAFAHTLRARIAMATGEHSTALSELSSPVEVLDAYPAPLQALEI